MPKVIEAVWKIESTRLIAAIARVTRKLPLNANISKVEFSGTIYQQETLANEKITVQRTADYQHP